CQQYTGSPTF
nr:immunoglobulin light chain junction region [Macaca mulatta]